MAVTLDATLGGASANSYIDVASADALMPTLVSVARANTWTAQGADAKALLLIRAVKLIEAYVDFDGVRLVNEQSIDWPRDFVYGPDRTYPYQVTEIPGPVKEAQALMALNLAEGFDQATASGSPVDSFQLASLKVNFASSRAARSSMLLPSEVIEKLRGFGEYVGTSGLARSIQLVRG